MHTRWARFWPIIGIGKIVQLDNDDLLASLYGNLRRDDNWYRTMVLKSTDEGKTWTEPVPSQPFLMNIAPTLAVLDNGVVVCRYGRPGFHVAFSLDHGHTWQDHIRFSDLPEPVITGQFDLVKVGPNRLVAIGSDAAETKTWSIEVERKKVPQSHVVLEGQVLDSDGNPIADANVERSPSRYYLDACLEHATELDPWKATPMTIGSPVLGYKSIRTENGHPTAQTDARGRFRFEHVELGEYVLTVEADGYAPQSQNITARPESAPQQFALKSGRKVRGRVVDDTGQPVPGACVVLNLWHVHTDDDGYFDWSLAGPEPESVAIRAYKRYDGRYQEFKGTETFVRIERHPITIPLTK